MSAKEVNARSSIQLSGSVGAVTCMMHISMQYRQKNMITESVTRDKPALFSVGAFASCCATIRASFSGEENATRWNSRLVRINMPGAASSGPNQPSESQTIATITIQASAPTSIQRAILINRTNESVLFKGNLFPKFQKHWQCCRQCFKFKNPTREEAIAACYCARSPSCTCSIALSQSK